MEFTFRAQDHQLKAVNSVVSVFKGQEKKEDYKNFNLHLSDEQILNNIQKVQEENKINVSNELKKENGRYCIDISMETGTGKTYTYIRTIFELNKNYGWTKFIVVVPSSAIKLGVSQAFKDTRQHFRNEYGEEIEHFVYDSKNSNNIKNFGIDSKINVMIITMQSFAESNRNRAIYKEQDNLNSNSPIDVISNVNPIIIRDEPQRMDSKITNNSLEEFNPLFFLNYSATHRTIHNLIYDLDSLDAYKNQLVKRVEVKGIEIVNLSGANFYLHLEKIETFKEKPPLAKVEFERKDKKNRVKRVSKKLKQGDDLYLESGNLEPYKGIKIHEIRASEEGYIVLSNGIKITVDQLISSNDDDFQRIQIRETILSHFEKEKDLRKKNIKVLSLFFLDDVSNYRQYEGNYTTLGKYGKIFEDEYKKILNDYLSGNDIDDEYKEFLKLTQNDISKVHNGYFGKDKTTKTEQEKENDKVYDKILKDKKSLLDLEDPLRFIFTKFALREGWDCPNIFQICTLKHSSNEISKRQEIGRGMRLCVDQHGNRIDSNTSDFDVNTLTVIANESYEKFVQSLQSEYEEDYSDKNKDQNKHTIHNARNRIKVKIIHENKKKFLILWNKIKSKFTYKVQLDKDEMIEEIINKIQKNSLSVNLQKYEITRGEWSGKEFKIQAIKSHTLECEDADAKCDIIKDIADNTNLTRKTIYDILMKLGDNKIKEIGKNPQEFISKMCDLITQAKKEICKENIQYKKTKIDYKISIFESIHNSEDNLKEKSKSLQNYIQLDSKQEEKFAEELDGKKIITVYAKLPIQFKIPTPIGNYTPDWAIVCKNKTYFIIETKGTLKSGDRSNKENYKIDCARKLFGASSEVNKIKFEVCTNSKEFLRLTGIG